MLSRHSLVEQCAAHLIDKIDRGLWLGDLPGVDRLAVELGVSRETVRGALALVEKEGRLISRGSGYARQTVPGGRSRKGRSLRVAFLLHEPFAHEDGDTQSFFLRIKEKVEEGGHRCFFTEKAQTDFGGDVRKIARYLGGLDVDAWLVLSGSGELLKWFAKRPTPVLAIGGRSDLAGIAAVARNVEDAYRETFRRLIGLGHRRICVICPEGVRTGGLGPSLTGLRDELLAAGGAFGPYNMPGWEESPEGLRGLLDSLFGVTPPTALQVTFPFWMAGVLGFLAERGLRVPRDVSLVCETMDRTLAWHAPKIAHYRFDQDLALNRIADWLSRVAMGEDDRVRTVLPAIFEQGESIGPVRKAAK